MVITWLRARRDESQAQRRDFWERWSTRLVVTVCVLAALIAVALIATPGDVAWYTKIWEIVEAVIGKAHPDAG